MADLGAYVDRTIDLPWRWGQQDCTMWVADWCLARWNIDPAHRFRGTYSTELEARAITARGLAATVTPEIPLRRKSQPDCGDIGVIEINGHEVAAIWDGAHWIIRTQHGVGMVRGVDIAIWGD